MNDKMFLKKDKLGYPIMAHVLYNYKSLISDAFGQFIKFFQLCLVQVIKTLSFTIVT